MKEHDVPSTCTEYGSYDMVTYCTECEQPIGNEHFDYTELAPHTRGEAAKENDVPSTCTAYGSYDMVVRCTECREILESEHFDYTELAAHTYGEWVTVTAATCHTKGLAERTCVCGDRQEKELPFDFNNHDGATEVRNASEATCTGAGYTGDTYCLGCSNVIASGSAVSATGHVWGEWVTTTAPTDTENGEQTRECSVCHVTETRTVYAENSKVCMWCGSVHTGAWGSIILLAHTVIWFFHSVFGLFNIG
ncbi:MAG: hypothetical protein IK104_04390 [Clostridia bacterium]|nr:hypothetical protein [Clostridia bacterium]